MASQQPSFSGFENQWVWSLDKRAINHVGLENVQLCFAVWRTDHSVMTIREV
jgi:hypothetical protein